MFTTHLPTVSLSLTSEVNCADEPPAVPGARARFVAKYTVRSFALSSFDNGSHAVGESANLSRRAYAESFSRAASFATARRWNSPGMLTATSFDSNTDFVRRVGSVKSCLSSDIFFFDGSRPTIAVCC